jgi:hypothetical protein
MARNCGWLLGAEDSLSTPAWKKWKLSVLQLQETEFWNNLSVLRNVSFPNQAPDDAEAPADKFDNSFVSH